jgi:phage FluMu protein Com
MSKQNISCPTCKKYNLKMLEPIPCKFCNKNIDKTNGYISLGTDNFHFDCATVWSKILQDKTGARVIHG